VTLLDRAAFRERWSDLHGGYDQGESGVAARWLSLVEGGARPLASRGLAPGVLTGAGVAAAAAAMPAALAGGRWRLAAATAVVGSGFSDGLDGAVAVLSGRDTPAGYLLDSLADRVSDAAFLLSLRLAGASERVIYLAALGIAGLEYGRARAGNAGFGEIGIVTVGERPIRLIVTAGGLAAAGLLPGRSREAASAAALLIGVLAGAGTGQFLRLAFRRLNAPQAGPISPATARADSATSGKPPPG